MPKLDKATRARLYSLIDDAAANNYHQIYSQMGEEQAKNGNFHCWNNSAHSDGTDANASLSVRNDTGQYKCHTCGITGNLNKYYKEYVANGPHDKWGGSFTQFALDILNLKQYMPDDMEDKRNLQQAMEMLNGIQEAKPKQQAPKPQTDPKKTIKCIKRELNDAYVNELLKNSDILNYLWEKRRVNKEVIEKYRIGFTAKQGCITFPVMDGKGNILNIKMYRPWNPKMKWQYMVKGNPIIPGPIINFTGPKLYIFEGEPDCYCAIAHGYNGVTFGSVANTTLRKIFGRQFDTIFQHKEIVIVMDADDPGEQAAYKIAKELYGTVKQIKIINLNKSEINPNGLDPEKTENVQGKQKRIEKDFTDFMSKNSWGDRAKKLFDKLETDTQVYTQNVSRTKEEMFKVTLSESINSRYYNKDSKKHLELIASIFDMDESIYKYPTKLCVSCRPMFDVNLKSGMCKKCSLQTYRGFGDPRTNEMIFNLIRYSLFTGKKGEFDIPVNEYDLLGTIQVSEEKRYRLKKKILEIPDRCNDVRIDEIKLQSLCHARLSKDPDEATTTESDQFSRRGRSGNDNDTVEAYLLEERLEINKSFRLKAIQTRSPAKQSTVLFAYHIEPLEASFDHFEMDDEMYDTLSIFKPEKEGQTIQEHLTERYKIFGNAAGINSRDDLFFLNDLAYFSTLEIDNKETLPSIHRGWVEILVAGEPRCGKTIAGEFQYNHYKVGEFIGGTNAIKRTGLLGGIVPSFGTSKIRWGKFPQNDGGMVIIDEMSRITADDLHSLTDLRSSGYAEIDMSVRERVKCRVRKAFYSNWRGWKEEDINTSVPGIEMLRDLCLHDAVLARFDIATVVRSDDVTKFDSKYEQISSKFTSYQCKNLIYWAYSRKPNQIIYEEGFSKLLNDAQEKLLEIFHSSTQLVNQEMRAKLARMSISLATMLFSTSKNDWNCILVKNDHLKYMVKYLIDLYSSKNISMDEYSKEKKQQEQIGDMRFMMNILKYIDINSIINLKEGSEKDICCIFADYLLRVTRSQLFIVDGKSNHQSTQYKSHEINDKFIGVLRARNCIVKTRRNKYKKTEAFSRWLLERKQQGDNAESSDILEISTASNRLASPVSDPGIVEGARRFKIGMHN